MAEGQDPVDGAQLDGFRGHTKDDAGGFVLSNVLVDMADLIGPAIGGCSSCASAQSQCVLASAGFSGPLAKALGRSTSAER